MYFAIIKQKNLRQNLLLLPILSVLHHWFSVHLQSCEISIVINFRTFSSLQKYIPPLLRSPSSSLLFTLLSVSMGLPILDISYKLCHTICDLLRLAYFTWHNVFKVHWCCSMYQYFILFYGWIILHSLESPHFIYLCNQLMGIWFVSTLAIMNNASMKQTLGLCIESWSWDIENVYQAKWFRLVRSVQWPWRAPDSWSTSRTLHVIDLSQGTTELDSTHSP